MNLFYAAPSAISDGFVTFDEDEARHAAQVLRAKEGDRIWVTDGAGSRYACEVDEIGRRSVRLRIESASFMPPSPLPVLAVGLLKNRDRLEWIVEKSVELGVEALVLMHTERSERAHVREDRLRGIQISAMKQCLSDWLPGLKVLDYAETLRRYAARPALIAHEKAELDETPSVSAALAPLLLVGPEGGFTEAEVDEAVATGAFRVSLGPRRLRTETAALALLAKIILP